MPIDKPTVVLQRFFLILWVNSVHIKTFAIICSCFYWTSSEFQSISCWGLLYRVSLLWRQWFKRSNQIYISSQVKSALRKFSKGKDHDCDSFMYLLLYKSCVSHLAIWATLFAEFKCLDQIPPFANNWLGKGWNIWVVSAWYKRFYWWSWNKLFDQY